MNRNLEIRRSAYRASTDEKPDKLFTIDRLVRVLRRDLFGVGRQPPQHGLVVVAGSTGSAKSQIARGLIFRYLVRTYKAKDKDKDKDKESQHLLTFEDPIEVPFFKDDANPFSFDHEMGQQQELTQTPRELGKDVRNLRQAIRDALRQKPAVFYIGEVRDEEDWPAILDFAGTGHFVLATTHAGSLSELLSKLLHAVKAETPAQRGYYASRLLGLVHLSPFLMEKDLTALLPALWRRTGDAVARLVNDYLGSLLATDIPRTLKPAAPEHYVLGRSYFARRLLAPNDSRLKKLLPLAKLADLKGE